MENYIKRPIKYRKDTDMGKEQISLSPFQKPEAIKPDGKKKEKVK